LYYNPKTFGTAWMKASGMKEEKMKEANMGKIFGISYVLSFLMCIMLGGLVVHQTDVYSLYAGQEGFGVDGSDVMIKLDAFMAETGGCFRTFEHGAFHGVILGVFIALPILMINGLFERKSLKYGFINAGFWIICMALCGGIIC
jgi:hypothetical protein